MPFLIWAVAVVWSWSVAGPGVGLAVLGAPLLFVLPKTARALYLHTKMLLNPTLRRDYGEFVNAWEQRFGEISGPGTEVPGGLFEVWRAAKRNLGVSAGRYLDDLQRPRPEHLARLQARVPPGERVLATARTAYHGGRGQSAVFTSGATITLLASDSALYALREDVGTQDRLPYAGIRQATFDPVTGWLRFRLGAERGGGEGGFILSKATPELGPIVVERSRAAVIHAKRVAFDCEGRGALFEFVASVVAGRAPFWTIHCDPELTNTGGQEFQTWMRETVGLLNEEFGIAVREGYDGPFGETLF